MAVFPLLISACILLTATALEVSNGSPCADICDGPSLTFFSDLVCNDEAYSTTDRGRLMQSCMECESQSTYVDSEVSSSQNNDQYWMLFNAKYTLQYCLFQSERESTPNYEECFEECSDLSPALTPSWFGTPRPAQYHYCTISENAFNDNADRCAACLQSGVGSVILGNLLGLMEAGCDSQAAAQDGELIPIARQLFNAETVALSNPASTSTLTATSAPSASSTSSSSSSSQTSESTTSPTSSESSPTSTPSTELGSTSAGSSDSSLSPGAAAGIAIAATIVVLGLGLLAYRHIRRRRNTVRVPRSMLEQGSNFQPLNDYDGRYGASSQGQSLGQGSTFIPASGFKSVPRTGIPTEVAGHERYEIGGKEGGVSVEMVELDGSTVGSRG